MNISEKNISPHSELLKSHTYPNCKMYGMVKDKKSISCAQIAAHFTSFSKIWANAFLLGRPSLKQAYGDDDC